MKYAGAFPAPVAFFSHLRVYVGQCPAMLPGCFDFAGAQTTGKDSPMKKCTAMLLALGLILPVAGAASAKSPARQNRFEKCDEGGKGFLTQEEFGNCYLRAAAKFQALDADRDGKVTQAEVKEARVAAKKARQAKAVQNAKGE